MQELVKKIKQDAEARLPLPPGRQATEELARYKGFLKLETHRLKMAHRAGAGGLPICHARAAVLDELLRHLWNAARASLSEQAQEEFPALALAAINAPELCVISGPVEMVAAFHEQLQHVVPLPRVPEWEQITTHIIRAGQAVVAKQKTVAKAVSDLDRQVNELLDKRRWIIARHEAQQN